MLFRSLISRPYTLKFPKEPSPPFEKFRGAPRFTEEKCVGCTACAQVCPAKAIEVKDDKATATRTLTVRHDTCIYCGQCQANCLTFEGIKLTTEYDLAAYKREEVIDSVEKKLLLCSDCGEIIAPEDQLIWVAKRVGSAAFSNPTLYLSYLKSLNLSYPELAEPVENIWRADRMKVLCTSCRRRTTLNT